jgi:hypothetical protein
MVKYTQKALIDLLEEELDSFNMLTVSVEMDTINHLLEDNKVTQIVSLNKHVVIVKLIVSTNHGLSVLKSVTIRIDKSIEFYHITWMDDTGISYRVGKGGTLVEWDAYTHSYFDTGLFSRLEETLFKLEDRFGIPIMDKL